MAVNSVESIRKLCLSFPHATEQVQWGYDLVFKIGGKMFAITPLEPAPVFLTFKATEESFAELTERPGIIPAPYLARAKWVAMENADALSPQELAALLRLSYDLVLAKLPKRTQGNLAAAKSKRKTSASRSKRRRK
ncbi:MAG TPA: MmcQ/YjbR family DNA-binding protein [Candidatus Acidoferrum sp.]|nr:MmcQ/YjbR family DNA-binding protein [Candidatus Acidoferrum sp.]